jgi:hypothetical protein
VACTDPGRSRPGSKVPPNSSTATASSCRLPRTEGHSEPAAHGRWFFVPVRLLAAVNVFAGLRGAPAYQAQVVGSVFFCVPHGVIL